MFRLCNFDFLGFTQKIEYFLVHQLKMSNKLAKTKLSEGSVKINGITVYTNVLVSGKDQIELNDVVIRSAQKHILILYYKPVGKISSLSPDVKDSLYNRFKEYLPLCIAGRLDKNSEGLLLLTNNGKLAQQITHPLHFKTKTYEVSVDKPVTEAFLENMRNGIEIMGKTTRPCKCEKTAICRFEISLTEGRNKQIRRMCKKQNYRVVELKRWSVDCYNLNKLLPDTFEMLNID